MARTKDRKNKQRRKGAKPARKVDPRFTAATADKHDLYQLAVQDPEFEIPWLAELYRDLRGKEPLHFREDFCGTALAAAHWVQGHPERTAEGFDLDQTTLDWGVRHNLEPLGEAAQRVTLQRADVRSKGIPADIRSAHNFSYNVFHTRQELLEYFRACLEGLADDGILTLDMYGGTEAHEPLEEERWIGENDDFIYVWDQDEHFPGTHEHRCFIHFRFPDGTKIERAFHYDWRLWSMPEVKDALAEVGFSRVLSYFETYDDDGDGTGEFEMDERGHASEGWLAYVVALK